MKITLKDGSSKVYDEKKAIINIAKDISEGLARVACAATVDGKVVDLRTEIDTDCELNILTFNDEEGKAAYRLMACRRYSIVNHIIISRVLSKHTR